MKFITKKKQNQYGYNGTLTHYLRCFMYYYLGDWCILPFLGIFRVKQTQKQN